MDSGQTATSLDASGGSCGCAGAGPGVPPLIAFLIPKRYQSTTRLMPPDQPSSSMAMLAAASGSSRIGLGSLAGDLLGLKSSGALFIGILESRTVQDDLISSSSLRKIYGVAHMEDARRSWAKTRISEDRKSGIITIEVTDNDPKRAAAMAEAYVEELNRVVAQLNTSSAHRERIFLEDRLHTGEAGFGIGGEKFQRVREQKHGHRHPGARQSHGRSGGTSRAN